MWYADAFIHICSKNMGSELRTLEPSVVGVRVKSGPGKSIDYCSAGTCSYRLIYSENSIFSPSGKAGELMSRAAAAVAVGVCYSMVVTGFTRTVCQVHFHFEHGGYSDLDVVYFEARVQLAILFTASLFGVIWISNHFVSEGVGVQFFTAEQHQIMIDIAE